jgi:hypothetical protein
MFLFMNRPRNAFFISRRRIGEDVRLLPDVRISTCTSDSVFLPLMQKNMNKLRKSKPPHSPVLSLYDPFQT